MSFYLAKLLQALGCADVGYALLVGVTEERGMGKELLLLGIGVVVFALGRYLEAKATA
ncbi:MAG: hypothetical protein AB1671_09590 [Thermodesulfobacteriota bacterium]|jgi:hypothetical protein